MLTARLPAAALATALLGVLLATMFALPHRAFAHAVLMASTPAVESSVRAGQVAITLRYNSRIDRARSRVSLTRPDRTQSVLPVAADGPPDALATSATLTPGAYVLHWQVLAIDGHITRGDVPFSVTAP